MIATIIMVVLIVLLILDLILTTLLGDSDKKSGDTGSSLFGLAVWMAIFITLGYTGTDSERKASIEKALSRGSHYATYEAFWYNKRLEFFDNYFCRFTLRPDSDYIDVEYYEAEQNG